MQLVSKFTYTFSRNHVLGLNKLDASSLRENPDTQIDRKSSGENFNYKAFANLRSDKQREI